MNYSAPLYLASQSPMRRELLTLADIPFTLLDQQADESCCDWSQDPALLAAEIARSKMEHTVLPTTGDTIFVLTADTVCVDQQGKSHGKPVDAADAIRMLHLWRTGCTAITGFCLEKKRMRTTWQTEELIEETVSTTIDFCVPDEWVPAYLEHTRAYECAGGMAIEGYGFQFVKGIQGSYANILGLPLYEVRKALQALQFFTF